MKKLILLVSLILLLIPTLSFSYQTMYVTNENCICTSSLELLSYLWVLVNKKDDESLLKMIKVGLATGDIVVLPKGKKVFILKDLNHSIFVIKPDGSRVPLVALKVDFGLSPKVFI